MKESVSYTTTIAFCRKNTLIYASMLILLFFSACDTKKKTTETQERWKSAVAEKLPLMGHRNWILVVDKAFPLQNGEGIEIIYTNEQLLPVLSHLLLSLEKSDHVKPIIYTDEELNYLQTKHVKGLSTYKKGLNDLVKGAQKTMLHDSVFTKIDQASKLFKILVLKTNEIIPYSSVFLELDCQYWNDEKENNLRKRMNTTMR